MADKKLLGVFTPPKPISQMSDQERKAFARQIAEQTSVEPKPVPAPPNVKRA